MPVKKESAQGVSSRKRTRSNSDATSKASIAPNPMPTIDEKIQSTHAHDQEDVKPAPRRVSPSIAPPRAQPDAPSTTTTTTTGVAKTHTTSPMSSKPHDEELTMASGLVLDHFGPTVQSVFDCLAMKGELPFLAILA